MPSLINHCCNALGVTVVVWSGMCRLAGRQVGPGLPDRRVERGARDDRRVVVGAHVEGLVVPINQCAEAGPRDLHALGLAGGPGGVDDVRNVVGRDCGLRSLRGGVHVRELGDDVEDGTLEGPDPRCRLLIGQHDSHARVDAEIRQACVRVRGVESDVAAADAEHGELGDDQLDRTVEAHRDENTGPDSESAQSCGERVGGRGRAPRKGDAAATVGNRLAVTPRRLETHGDGAGHPSRRLTSGSRRTLTKPPPRLPGQPAASCRMPLRTSRITCSVQLSPPFCPRFGREPPRGLARPVRSPSSGAKEPAGR